MGKAAGLRVGELAELAGVTTRTIRHYHRIGLLPEPPRQDNGYRVYCLRDAARLLRIRRLVDLGLSLDEIGDALADDAGRELREILDGLDADLAAQQRRVEARRGRIAELLAREGGLASSAEQAVMLAALERAAGSDHPGLERERLIADLIEPTVGPARAPAAWETYGQILADAGLAEAMLDASRRFEQLAGIDPEDPAVEALAREGGSFGEAVRALLPEELRRSAGDPEAAEILLRAVAAGMDPAQARCLGLMLGSWRGQRRDPASLAPAGNRPRCLASGRGRACRARAPACGEALAAGAQDVVLPAPLGERAPRRQVP
ncbi:MAG: MerR family transcriptional regulator [Acidimicrobiales bacterium]